MHRLVLLMVAFLVISAATIAFARSENSGSSGNSGRSGNRTEQQVEVENKIENKDVFSHNSQRGKPTFSASNRGPKTATSSGICDPNANWKNHGEYVSCVARLHLGGQTVSQAARSDIGKKKSSTPSASVRPSPTASVSASPTASASATPEATSSATTLANVKEEAKQIMNTIISLLARLQELFSF